MAVQPDLILIAILIILALWVSGYEVAQQKTNKGKNKNPFGTRAK